MQPFSIWNYLTEEIIYCQGSQKSYCITELYLDFKIISHSVGYFFFLSAPGITGSKISESLFLLHVFRFSCANGLRTSALQGVISDIQSVHTNPEANLGGLEGQPKPWSFILIIFGKKSGICAAKKNLSEILLPVNARCWVMQFLFLRLAWF